MTPVSIEPGNLNGQLIGKHIEYLRDPGKKLTIKDMADPNVLARFVKSDRDNLSFGYVQESFWIRFTVHNPTSSHVDWYLEIENPYHRIVEVYVPTEKGFTVKKVGTYTPPSEREIYSLNYIFSLSDAPGARVYFIRIETDTTMHIPLRIMSASGLAVASIRTFGPYCVFYATLIIVFLYNLFIFLSVREKSYFYYLLKLLAIMFMYMSFDSIGNHYVYPWSKYLQEHFIGFALPFFTITAVQFMRVYLSTAQRTRRLDIWLIVLMVLSIFAIPLTFVNVILAMLAAYLVMWLVIMTLVFYIAPYYLYKKSRPAIFYTLAYALYIAGATIRVMGDIGAQPWTFLTAWASPIGGMCMMILFSLGLADKINVMKNELADLNKNLEAKVEERTAELQAAMEELEAMNDSLKATMEELEATNEQLIETRDALWGEMQLAKKIQTVLLPEDPKIKGYDISAYMKPADEVGGDYYDIITIGDKDWIIIGDVSGHGVPAGLVMMMVQTSIQTALNQHPTLNPSALLATVNATIARNIRLLGESKYMTITVFACVDGGKMYYSGLHQDILVYRRQTGTVEAIPTSGMWIGLVEDINGMVSDETFSLASGDTMLLYTDGVTEAKLDRATMYSEKRLNDIFTANGAKTPSEVKDAIISSLEGYTCTDDVTLVVIKRI